jgi:DNA polymerase III subunit epsilon
LNLLIIDTETTGLNPTCDRVIELGAILYSVEYQTVLHQLSTLLSAPDNPAERINRIPAAVLPTISPVLMQQSLLIFQTMVDQADYVVAHNAAFDRKWFNGTHLPELHRQGDPLPWLCTMDDFTFPLQNRSGDSLINLALAHGIGVGSAHRALTDCQLIAALFDRMDDLSNLIALARQPKIMFQAMVEYDDRHLAKSAGFKWNSDHRVWLRRMTEAEALQLPFAVAKFN